MEGLANRLNCECDVATSDKHFEELAQRIDQYALIILDPWTWAAPGWVPKPPLRGNEARIFLLDFFGAKQVTSPKGQHPNLLKVPPERMLTAFPTSPWNTFLGYAISPSQMPVGAAAVKKRQGVIWGKDAKHYQGRENMLRALADSCDCELHSTLGTPLIKHPNIKYHGHLTKEGWNGLLSTSRFMIGLGNPLVGPSAVDAVVAGAVYINPVYAKPVREVYRSQVTPTPRRATPRRAAPRRATPRHALPRRASLFSQPLPLPLPLPLLLTPAPYPPPPAPIPRGSSGQTACMLCAVRRHRCRQDLRVGSAGFRPVPDDTQGAHTRGVR